MVTIFGRWRRGSAGDADPDESGSGASADGPTALDAPAEPLSEQPERCVCTLSGELTGVGLRSIGGTETLEATLDDGSATITLIWLGQREIAGIVPGRRLTIHGRIGRRAGEHVIYNPRYELQP